MIPGSVTAASRQGYSEIVWTTLETGRALTVGSLASFASSSSYCGSVCTGVFARIATTLPSRRPSAAAEARAGLRPCALEVVHQDDAFAELVDLLHHGIDHRLRLAWPPKVEESRSQGENRDVAGAEIESPSPADAAAPENGRTAGCECQAPV